MLLVTEYSYLYLYVQQQCLLAVAYACVCVCCYIGLRRIDDVLVWQVDALLVRCGVPSVNFTQFNTVKLRHSTH